MPTKEEFLTAPQRFVLLVLGMPDSGKSDLMMSFPGVYVIGFDETGFGILRNKTERSQKLADNLVHIEYPRLHADLFRETGKVKPDERPRPINSEDRDSLFGCLKHATELAGEKKIQTLGIDGLNYLVGAKWQLICADPKNIAVSGELNRFAAYNDIKVYLNRLMWSILLPTATRNGLNLIVTAHIKRESPAAIEGLDAKGVKTGGGKLSKDSDLAPIIEGSFRNEIDGKFGGVIYLEHKPTLKRVGVETVAAVNYYAYCQKIDLSEDTLGTVILAKNKYGLPPRVNLTDKSFYEILLKQTAATVTPAIVEEKEKGAKAE